MIEICPSDCGGCSCHLNPPCSHCMHHVFDECPTCKKPIGAEEDYCECEEKKEDEKNVLASTN